MDVFDQELATPSGEGDTREYRCARRKLKGMQLQILKQAGISRSVANKLSDGASMSAYLWTHGCFAERKVMIRPHRLGADQIIADMTPYVQESSRFSERCKKRLKQL